MNNNTSLLILLQSSSRKAHCDAFWSSTDRFSDFDRSVLDFSNKLIYIQICLFDYLVYSAIAFAQHQIQAVIKMYLREKSVRSECASCPSLSHGSYANVSIYIPNEIWRQNHCFHYK